MNIDKSKTSEEFQELVLQELLVNDYIFYKTRSYITSEFFSNDIYRVIYNNLSYYYSKYDKAPSKSELLVVIKDYGLDSGSYSNEDISSTLELLYSNSGMYSEEFVLDSVTKFIKRGNTEKVLAELLPKLIDSSDTEISIDDIGDELSKSMNINFKKGNSFQLSEDRLPEVRREAIGTDDNPTVIKSVVPAVNNSLQFKGYKPGDLVLVCCLRGDTPVLTTKGTCSIESLSKMYRESRTKLDVYTKDPDKVEGDNSSVEVCTYDQAVLTKYSYENIILTLDSGVELESTPDHQFLTSDGLWIEAQDLKEGMLLSTLTESGEECQDAVSITKVRKVYYEDPIPMYDLVGSGPYSNFSVGAGSGVAIITHNSPPGCFVGSTELLLPEGRVEVMEELSLDNTTNFSTYNIDPNSRSITEDIADSVLQTRWVDVLTTITINGRDITCTLDHPFLLPNGSYLDAACLIPGTKILGISSEGDPTEFEVEATQEKLLPNKVPVYGVVDSGDFHNYALDIGGGNGVFVSNTGKTMYLVNEGYYASVQGYKVLHIFLGDMNNYDGFVRYASRYTQVPQDTIVAMSIEDQQALVRSKNFQQYFDNIVTSAHAAAELSVHEMIQEVERLQDKYGYHFDLILVDYADNLKPEADMMYESGGIIYDKLAYLAFTNKSVVMVASQPKPAYWDQEIIPKAGAAESSRKQHVTDIMLNIGKAPGRSDIGSIHLAKVRRGNTGIARLKFEFDKAKVEGISEQEYAQLKSEGFGDE